MKYPSAKLIVFSKAPIAGQVKTRLAKITGDESAVKIHEHLVRHCLKIATSANLAPVELWCSPSQGHAFFQQCRREFTIQLKEQGEGNLGQRMSRAFLNGLSDADCVVLIGTDCPVMTEENLAHAFSLLENGDVTVIGPAEDGGYVLLGMSQYQASLFENIPWGTERVLNETCDKLDGDYGLLPVLWDVDYHEDLQRLISAKLNLEKEFQNFLQDFSLRQD